MLEIERVGLMEEGGLEVLEEDAEFRVDKMV
jgi:hypothetical protein